MKLFIYYSFSGNGDIVANKMKDNGYDIRKVEVKNKLPKILFFQLMVGGFKALIKYKEKLIDFDSDISNYDEIVIGSPIWYDRVSSPIVTVLNKLDLSNKKLSFILYSGSGNGNVATKYLLSKYDDVKITILKQPKDNIDELNKIFKD